MVCVCPKQQFKSLLFPDNLIDNVFICLFVCFPDIHSCLLSGNFTILEKVENYDNEF